MSFVKKLDNPVEFNVWFNYYHAFGKLVPPNKGPIQWIADNHATIEKYIRDTHVEPKYKT